MLKKQRKNLIIVAVVSLVLSVFARLVMNAAGITLEGDFWGVTPEFWLQQTIAYAIFPGLPLLYYFVFWRKR